jgi:hypothetical protein
MNFEHADCYFKWLELAVFGGVRPNGRPDVLLAVEVERA